MRWAFDARERQRTAERCAEGEAVVSDFGLGRTALALCACVVVASFAGEGRRQKEFVYPFARQQQLAVVEHHVDAVARHDVRQAHAENAFGLLLQQHGIAAGVLGRGVFRRGLLFFPDHAAHFALADTQGKTGDRRMDGGGKYIHRLDRHLAAILETLAQLYRSDHAGDLYIRLRL